MMATNMSNIDEENKCRRSVPAGDHVADEVPPQVALPSMAPPMPPPDNGATPKREFKLKLSKSTLPMNAIKDEASGGGGVHHNVMDWRTQLVPPRLPSGPFDAVDAEGLQTLSTPFNLLNALSVFDSNVVLPTSFRPTATTTSNSAGMPRKLHLAAPKAERVAAILEAAVAGLPSWLKVAPAAPGTAIPSHPTKTLPSPCSPPTASTITTAPMPMDWATLPLQQKVDALLAQFVDVVREYCRGVALIDDAISSELAQVKLTIADGSIAKMLEDLPPLRKSEKAKELTRLCRLLDQIAFGRVVCIVSVALALIAPPSNHDPVASHCWPAAVARSLYHIHRLRCAFDQLWTKDSIHSRKYFDATINVDGIFQYPVDAIAYPSYLASVRAAGSSGRTTKTAPSQPVCLNDLYASLRGVQLDVWRSLVAAACHDEASVVASAPSRLTSPAPIVTRTTATTPEWTQLRERICAPMLVAAKGVVHREEGANPVAPYRAAAMMGSIIDLSRQLEVMYVKDLSLVISQDLDTLVRVCEKAHGPGSEIGGLAKDLRSCAARALSARFYGHHVEDLVDAALLQWLDEMSSSAVPLLSSPSSQVALLVKPCVDDIAGKVDSWLSMSIGAVLNMFPARPTAAPVITAVPASQSAMVTGGGRSATNQLSLGQRPGGNRTKFVEPTSTDSVSTVVRSRSGDRDDVEGAAPPPVTNHGKASGAKQLPSLVVAETLGATQATRRSRKAAVAPATVAVAVPSVALENDTAKSVTQKEALLDDEPLPKRGRGSNKKVMERRGKQPRHDVAENDDDDDSVGEDDRDARQGRRHHNDAKPPKVTSSRSSIADMLPLQALKHLSSFSKKDIDEIRTIAQIVGLWKQVKEGSEGSSSESSSTPRHQKHKNRTAAKAASQVGQRESSTRRDHDEDDAPDASSAGEEPSSSSSSHDSTTRKKKRRKGGKAPPKAKGKAALTSRPTGKQRAAATVSATAASAVAKAEVGSSRIDVMEVACGEATRELDRIVADVSMPAAEREQALTASLDSLLEMRRQLQRDDKALFDPTTAPEPTATARKPDRRFHKAGNKLADAEPPGTVPVPTADEEEEEEERSGSSQRPASFTKIAHELSALEARYESRRLAHLDHHLASGGVHAERSNVDLTEALDELQSIRQALLSLIGSGKRSRN